MVDSNSCPSDLELGALTKWLASRESGSLKEVEGVERTAKRGGSGSLGWVNNEILSGIPENQDISGPKKVSIFRAHPCS